jgi:hypothetical protein
MEEGEYGLAAEPISAVELLRAARDRSADQAQLVGVGLEVASGAATLAAIADRTVMGRLLDRLVWRAVGEVPEGGRVVLTANPSGSKVALVVCEVAPQGKGRACGVHETWLRTADPPASAYGASLHYCRLVAEAHGGSFGVEGDPGSRRWVVKLPIKAEDRLGEKTQTK